MHIELLLLIVTIFGVLIAPTYQVTNYTVNIESIVANPKKSKSLYRCVMETGNCNVDESIIRALIRGAFVHFHGIPAYVGKYVYHLVENDEDHFFKLAEKYDKEDGIFRKLANNRKLRCQKT